MTHASSPTTHHTELDRAQQANSSLADHVKDRWYPVFHIAAPAGWINDPNGLSHYNGRYQVFFQHHPYSTSWGPMHWGHVSSENLVTWQREPLALAPSLDEDSGGVYSGSAVTGPDGQLYAYYTGNRWKNPANRDEGNVQVQCLATSADGLTFTKQGTVIGTTGLENFRDPKVFQREGRWYMALGATGEDGRGQVHLYTSNDMMAWDFSCVLYEDPREDVFMLECPDLFELDGKWVLMFCPERPRPVGYRNRNTHNAGYQVGDWQPGGTFVPLTDYRQVDWGHNFYAPQTLEAPDGRRICWGWMGSFTLPVASQAEDGWAGQLTIPRHLSLGPDLNLVSTPLEELKNLRQKETDIGPRRLEANQRVSLLEGVDAFELEITLDLSASSAERIGIMVGNLAQNSYAYLGYDAQAGRVFLDRRLTVGDGGYRSAAVPVEGVLTLRIFADRGSIEVFINDGFNTISSLVFNETESRDVVLVAESGDALIDACKAWQLGSIWV